MLFGNHLQGKKLVRTVAMEQLSRMYKKVDCLGPCGRNADPPSTDGMPPGTHGIERTIWFYRAYKFVLCFENSPAKGWITEKLVAAYLAGSIMVYWGPPDLPDYINTGLAGGCFFCVGFL